MAITKTLKINWYDDNNIRTKRATSYVVKLYSRWVADDGSGEYISAKYSDEILEESKVINDDNNWYCEFDNLAETFITSEGYTAYYSYSLSIYDSVNEIYITSGYTIEGYKFYYDTSLGVVISSSSQLPNSSGSFSSDAVLIFCIKDNITISNAWEDNNNTQSFRPSALPVVLTATYDEATKETYNLTLANINDTKSIEISLYSQNGNAVDISLTVEDITDIEYYNVSIIQNELNYMITSVIDIGACNGGGLIYNINTLADFLALSDAGKGVSGHPITINIKNDLDFLNAGNFEGLGEPITSTIWYANVNGNKHSLSNISYTGSQSWGLFNGQIVGSIKELSLKNIYVDTTGKYAGGFIWGCGDAGIEMTDCTVLGGSIKGGYYVGGLAGAIKGGKTRSAGSKFTRCGVSLNLHAYSANFNMGGLFGHGRYYISSANTNFGRAVIKRCYTICNYTSSSTGYAVAGFVAQGSGEIYIINSFCRGNILCDSKYVYGMMNNVNFARFCYSSIEYAATGTETAIYGLGVSSVSTVACFYNASLMPSTTNADDMSYAVTTEQLQSKDFLLEKGYSLDDGTDKFEIKVNEETYDRHAMINADMTFYSSGAMYFKVPLAPLAFRSIWGDISKKPSPVTDAKGRVGVRITVVDEIYNKTIYRALYNIDFTYPNPVQTIYDVTMLFKEYEVDTGGLALDEGYTLKISYGGATFAWGWDNGIVYSDVVEQHIRGLGMKDTPNKWYGIFGETFSKKTWILDEKNDGYPYVWLDEFEIKEKGSIYLKEDGQYISLNCYIKENGELSNLLWAK